MSGMYICCICDDECGYYTINRKNKKNSKLCRVFLPRHSAKQLFFNLPEKGFAECQMRGTRQRTKLRRVPVWQHSAKLETSPSAASLALGEVWIFAKCHASGTRQSFRPRPVRPSRSPVRPSRFYFFCRVRLGTRRRFAECPRKGTRQSRLRR